MEIWILFVLGHIVAATILGILDYNLIQKVYKNAVVASIVTCSFFLLFAVLFFIAGVNWELIPISLGILAGFLSFISSYIYSLCFEKKMSPGFVLSIWKIQMFFAFVYGVFFLGEKLTGVQLLGHGIIFFSAMYLTLFHSGTSTGKKDIFLPLFGAVLFSSSFIIVDPLYKDFDFKTVFSSFCLGFGLGAPFLILFHKKGKEYFGEIRLQWKKFIKLGILTESIALIEFGGFHLAMKYGPLSLVVFLKETYVVLLIIVSVIGAYFYPKYFPDGGENFNIRKLLIIGIMLLGVYLALN